MTRLFINNTIAPETEMYEIEGNDARYLSDVLRVRAGEEIILCDASSSDLECVIETVSKGHVMVSVKDRHPNTNEPKYLATVYQGLAKGERMDLSIQKSVELGVSRYVPTACSRSIVKMKAGEKGGKLERWQSIALEAARQCGRGIVPKVDSPLELKEALQKAVSENDLVLFPWEEEKEKKLGEILDELDFSQKPKIAVFIGPEGGFSEEEAQMARELGAKPVTLGKRILRTETAGPAVLAMLVYRSELN